MTRAFTITIADCAGCGAPKVVRNPCAMCGGVENVPGTQRERKS